MAVILPGGTLGSANAPAGVRGRRRSVSQQGNRRLVVVNVADCRVNRYPCVNFRLVQPAAAAAAASGSLVSVVSPACIFRSAGGSGNGQ